jgi:hypothetical protein
MAWKGDKSNPIPNPVREELSRAGEVKTEKTFPGTAEPRAVELRRDTDNQKNITYTLNDIDTTIINHIRSLKLSVLDNGEMISVPLYYASPERWKSIQKDGFMRDVDGKLQLPAMIINRATSAKDQSIMTFNRYLRYSVMKMYSRKNAYNNFAVLNNIAPTHEVYNTVMPDHMVFTYQCIIWTEYVEQMNSLVERLNFEAEDYWGPERGVRFRTKIDDFNHTTELQSNQDRMVRSEFNIVVNGYLLPDKFGENFKSTTEKYMTPRRLIINNEITVTSDELARQGYLQENAEKWRNKQYPNLQRDTFIPPVPVGFGDSAFAEPSSASKKSYLNSLENVLSSEYYSKLGDTQDIWHSPPSSETSPGQEGWVAYDSDYFYVFIAGKWLKTPISQFN